MRILTLIHEYPPVGGGGGRVARDLALGLVEHGHEVHVLTTHMEGLPSDEQHALPNSGGVLRVQRINTNRKTAFRASLAEMASYNLNAVLAARRLIRNWKPDLIHAHFAVPAGAAAYLLSRLSDIPYVLTAHLGDVPGAVPEKTEQWFRWLLPLTHPIWQGAADIVAVSEFTRQMAQKHYNVPIRVIPNGVDLAALPKKEPRAPHNPVQIVFAGRFMDQKNPGHLVNALSGLGALNWQCSMPGDGPLLEDIRRQISQSGLSERINLPGWVTPEQVLGEFSRADILVLPSRSEGLSVVGVQALGMGLALVVSNAGGNLELVDAPHNGYVFEVGDVDALKGHLARLISDPQLLLDAQSQSKILAQKYNLPAIVSAYDQLFRGLIPSPSSN